MKTPKNFVSNNLKIDMKQMKNSKTIFRTIVAVTLTLLMICSALLMSPQVQAPIANAQTNSSTLLQYEWTQYMGNEYSQRYQPNGPSPATGDYEWTTVIGMPGVPVATNQPAGTASPGDNWIGEQALMTAFNGLVYIPLQRSLYALDPFNGQIIWRIDAPSWNFSGVSLAGSWTARGNGVTKLNNDHLLALNNVNGKLDFCYINSHTGVIEWQSGPLVASSPGARANVYIDDLKIWVGETGDDLGRNGFVTAFSFADLSKPPVELWQKFGEGFESHSGVQYGDGRVFVGGAQPWVVCFNVTTGETLWTSELKSEPSYAGSYYQGMYLRGTLSGYFYALNATNGNIIWTFNTGTPYAYWSQCNAVANGLVYEENLDGGLYCLNAYTGQLVWKYQGSEYYSGNPLLGDGKVYSQTIQDQARDWNTGQLVPAPEYACLNATTGELIWKKDIFIQGGASDRHTDSACLAYGALYLAEPIRSGPLPENVTYQTLVHCIASTQDWSQWLHDSAHSGNGASGPTNLTLGWKFTANGGFDSSASIVAGKVYVGSLDKNIYCLDAENGKLIWTFTTGARVHSSPAVANGKVYTGGEDGFFHCLDALTGVEIWKTPSGFLTQLYANYKPVLESSPCMALGNEYIGSNNGVAFCLNPNTGQAIWTYDTGNSIEGSIAVANGTAYVPARNGTIVALNANTGSVIWKATMAGETYWQRSSPVIVNDRLFIGCGQQPPKLFCFNSTNGNPLWVRSYLPTQTPSGSNATSAQYAGSPVYANGLIYISHEFSAMAVNATTGDPVWTTWLIREGLSTITYTDGKVYTGRTTGILYVLDATTGAKESFFTAGSEFLASPSFSGGKCYVGSWDWNFYCFADAIPPHQAFTDLAINVDKTQVNQGDSITISGTTTPALVDTPIKVSFIKPDQGTVTVQAISNSSGSFSTTYTPDVVGQWGALAYYDGDTSGLLSPQKC